MILTNNREANSLKSVIGERCTRQAQCTLLILNPMWLVVAQVYSNTPETINLIIEVFVEVAHKQICYLGEVSVLHRCASSARFLTRRTRLGRTDS